MTQQEARARAVHLWGLRARCIGEDDVISTVPVLVRRVGVMHGRDPMVRSLRTFEQYGQGSTWEEAFGDAEVKLRGEN